MSLKRRAGSSPALGTKNEGLHPHFFVPRRHLLFDWGMVSPIPFLSLRSLATAPSPSSLFVPRRHLHIDWGTVSQTPFLSLRSTAGTPSPSFFCARWLKSESGNQDGIDTTSLGNQSIHTSSIRRRKSSGVNTFVNIVSNSRR